MILAVVAGKHWVQTWYRANIDNKQAYRNNPGSTVQEKQLMEKTTILANPVAESQNFAMRSCIAWSTIKKSKEAVTSKLNRNSVFSKTKVVKNAKVLTEGVLRLNSAIQANTVILMLNHMHEHETKAQKNDYCMY